MRVREIANIPDQPLEEALALVARSFDVRRLLDRSYAHQDVVEYYRQSDRGYRLFHSREGALHIALGGDGHSDTACFARQAELFLEHLGATRAKRAIEFGAGMGYNVRRLAERRPDTQFVGVDLTESHVARARTACRGLPNVELLACDYQSLPHGDATFDGVLAVETLCQTNSQEAAIAEAARVLRPGGRLVVVDCFRRAPLERLAPPLAEAARLVEKTTAVNAFRQVDDWVRMAEAAGLSLVEQRDLSEETRQNLARLSGLARRYFAMPRAARAIASAFPPLLLQNAVCGLLMPYTVGLGAHAYSLIAVEKAEP